jgi:hypothetical protein
MIESRRPLHLSMYLTISRILWSNTRINSVGADTFKATDTPSIFSCSAICILNSSKYVQQYAAASWKPKQYCSARTIDDACAIPQQSRIIWESSFLDKFSSSVFLLASQLRIVLRQLAGWGGERSNVMVRSNVISTWHPSSGHHGLCRGWILTLQTNPLLISFNPGARYKRHPLEPPFSICTSSASGGMEARKD